MTKSTDSGHRETMPISLGPPPPAANPHVSKSMRANRASDTKPELALRKALWEQGLRGYRANWTGAPGRPDICFTKHKLAIFVHGCFWHRCPKCGLTLPKTNTEFWERKFVRNIERDRLKVERLTEAGWKSIVVWECDIKKRLDELTQEIASLLVQKD